MRNCTKILKKLNFYSTSIPNLIFRAHLFSIITYFLLILFFKYFRTMCSKHPGAVVQLVDSPIDPNKLLIGYETGLIVLWDLKNKQTEAKFAVQEGLHSLSFHSDGRYFMSSHTDGSLITWDVKTPTKPASIEQPHGKLIHLIFSWNL